MSWIVKHKQTEKKYMVLNVNKDGRMMAVEEGSGQMLLLNDTIDNYTFMTFVYDFTNVNEFKGV